MRWRRVLRLQVALLGPGTRRSLLEAAKGEFADRSEAFDESSREGIKYGPRIDLRRATPLDPNALNGLNRPVLWPDSDLGDVRDTNPWRCA